MNGDSQRMDLFCCSFGRAGVPHSRKKIDRSGYSKTGDQISGNRNRLHKQQIPLENREVFRRSRKKKGKIAAPQFFRNKGVYP